MFLDTLVTVFILILKIYIINSVIYMHLEFNNQNVFSNVR